MQSCSLFHDSAIVRFETLAKEDVIHTLTLWLSADLFQILNILDPMVRFWPCHLMEETGAYEYLILPLLPCQRKFLDRQHNLSQSSFGKYRIREGPINLNLKGSFNTYHNLGHYILAKSQSKRTLFQELPWNLVICLVDTQFQGTNICFPSLVSHIVDHFPSHNSVTISSSPRREGSLIIWYDFL